MSIAFAFLIPFLLSVIFFPFNIFLAKRWGFVDDPRKKVHPAILHKKIIPRAGGIAIFAAFFIGVILNIDITQRILGIFLGGLILVIVGLWDDKRDLNNWVKLGAQILAAVVVVGLGVGISYITNPFNVIGGLGLGEVIKLDSFRIVFHFLGTHSINVWADLFAIFWIVWVINMVNFSAGVDGQLGGIAFIALFVIFAASLRFSATEPTQALILKLALSGMGATLGFLIFNFAPAKIFPGDSASYFLGFLIAVLSIFSVAKVGTAILVMAVPLIDGVFTVIRRISERKSPFSGDRKHLHHRLLELGWTNRQVALFYWLLCAILGAAALTLSASQKLFAGILVAIIIIGGLLWLNMNLQIGDRK